MKRVAFYLTQKQLNGLAQCLYKLQHLVDVASGDGPASDMPFQLLSDLRKQCCFRSCAEDPSLDLPMMPRLTEARGRSNAQC